jgi:hypothetical protein
MMQKVQHTNLRNHQVLVISIDELWPWLPTVSAHPESQHFLSQDRLQHPNIHAFH